jgi:hypothetical protein
MATVLLLLDRTDCSRGCLRSVQAYSAVLTFGLGMLTFGSGLLVLFTRRGPLALTDSALLVVTIRLIRKRNPRLLIDRTQSLQFRDSRAPKLDTFPKPPYGNISL